MKEGEILLRVRLLNVTTYIDKQGHQLSIELEGRFHSTLHRQDGGGEGEGDGVGEEEGDESEEE